MPSGRKSCEILPSAPRLAPFDLSGGIWRDKEKAEGGAEGVCGPTEIWGRTKVRYRVKVQAASRQEGALYPLSATFESYISAETVLTYHFGIDQSQVR